MGLLSKYTSVGAMVLSTLTLTTVSMGVNSEPRTALKAALDPAANISDFYMFRSWEDSSKVIFILNVAPGQHPGDGPAYFGFGDDIFYRINIDNDTDGRADDIVYEFRFKTEDRPAFGRLSFTQPYVGNPAIVSSPELRGITALDGPGSEGLTFRQTYKVWETRGKIKKRLFPGTNIAAPSNVGPVTMPDYEMLAAQAIATDSRHNMRVFAGQRADSFYGDTGALFDGAAPRRSPPVATEDEDLNDTINPFGINRFEGFNVQSIILEVPIERLTRDGASASESQQPFLGAYASAGRYKHVHKWMPMSTGGSEKFSYRKSHQVSRMGNSMVKALVIDVPYKNAYNAASPERDERFSFMYFDPSLNRPPTSEIFGIPAPPPPRVDLVNLFLKYPGQSAEEFDCGYPCADLLRLDVAVPPTAPEQQQRLGSLLGTDPAGMPNGRRPHDDVLDFMVRLLGGPNLIAARVGDGVNYASGLPGSGIEDGPGYGSILGNRLDVTKNGIVKEFPFLATPHDGRSE